MPRRKIDDECEGRILALLQLNYSQRQIVKIFKNDGINVSQRTVSNVKRKIGLQQIPSKKFNSLDNDQYLHHQLYQQ